MFKIIYGRNKKTIDVTDICLNQLMYENIITIPSGDNYRNFFFSDPCIGVNKAIFILMNKKMYVYDEYQIIEIDTKNNKLKHIGDNYVYQKIKELHSELKLNYGSFEDEFPEQKMAIRYLQGNEHVLEIGGNIGRNSLVISSILGDNGKLVTLECDDNIACQLKENRELNNLDFHIENSALSKRKLIQKGWDTIPSDELLPDYKWVNTITLDELNEKYNIQFDTLVLDCEGAFYYILMDMPEILDNIKLIIMENDYHNIEHKKYVDNILIKNNFNRDYVEPGGWGPCRNNFFEVWTKIRK